MPEDLSEWVSETGAQGDPARYCKTDLEIWITKLFESFNFRAGKSNKERRRSFEEIWDVADGNPEAIACGFNAALKTRTYSTSYVKACIKNFSAVAIIAKTITPTIKAVSPTKVLVPVTPKPRKKSKPTEPEVPIADVEWK